MDFGPTPTADRVVLRCGTELVFDISSWAPLPGEVMPCRRHGYCTVIRHVGGADDSRSDPRWAARPRPRRQLPRLSSAELVTTLRANPGASLGTLRRLRFTLRILWAAHREGLVHLDLESGTVELLHPLDDSPPPAVSAGTPPMVKHARQSRSTQSSTS